jgi:hypothetical protein
VKAIKNQETKHTKLSIQVRLNGLSFCILDTETNQVTWSESLNFPKEYNPVKILGQIQLLYQKEEQLKQPVDEVVLLFSNQLYSLVPEKYFIPDESSSYLKFNIKILKTDVVAQDFLDLHQIVNVYIPYTNITNYFFDRYGEFEYRHSVSVFTDAVLRSDPGEGTRIYVNCQATYFDLVAIRDKELLLANTFSYQTPEDFIYYLLFTAEQIKADPLELELLMLGDISEDSEIYRMAFRYIKNISLFDPEFRLEGSLKSTAEFQRKYFLLLKSLGCE